MSKRKKHRHCHDRKHNKINILGPDMKTCDLKTNITKHKKVKRKKKRDKRKQVSVKDFNIEPFALDFDDTEEHSLSPITPSEETEISTLKRPMPTKKGDNSAVLQVQNLESENENNPTCLEENKTCRPIVKWLILPNSSGVKSDINIGVDRKENTSTQYKTSRSTQPDHANITDRRGGKQKKRHRKRKKTEKYENTSVFCHKRFNHGNGIENDVQLLTNAKKKKKRCRSRQFIYADEHRENVEYQDNTKHRYTTDQQDNEKHLDILEHLNNQNNDDHQDKTHDVKSENYKYMVTLYKLWRDVIQQDIQIHNQRLQLEKTKLETKQLLRDKLNQEEQLAELHLLVGSLNKIIEEKDEDISSLKQDFNYIQGLIEDNHGLVINHESLTEIQHRISDGVTMINSLANMLQSGMFDSK